MNENTNTQQNDVEISTVEEFVAWVKEREGQFLIYRGMANHDWPIEASISRRIRLGTTGVQAGAQLQSHDMLYRIETLLEQADLQGFRDKMGKRLEDLELLAELQHYGAATCLIDFTTNPLIALWFACNQEFDKGGRVIVMDTGASDEFLSVDSDIIRNKIDTLLTEEKKKQWRWDVRALNNRTFAQQSVFIFGKNIIDDKHYEYIKIRADKKQEIISSLQHKFGIVEEYLFSDLLGFSQANAHNKPDTWHTAENLFNQGLKFHQHTKYEKAIRCYDESIKIDPTNADAYNKRGDAKAMLENWQGATSDYSETIQINPDFATAYYNRGNAKFQSKDWPGAIEDFTEAIKRNSQYDMAYNNRGMAKFESKKLHDAIKDITKAININPQNADAYFNRGVAKRALGDLPESEKDFKMAKKLRGPDSTL